MLDSIDETPRLSSAGAAGSTHRSVPVAIIVPVVLGSIALLGLLALLARYVCKRRSKCKAPSAAFRAEHPELAQLPPLAPTSLRGTGSYAPSPTSFFARDEKRPLDTALCLTPQL